MTPRHHFFILEYLIDLDGTRAAIAAGYRPSNARSQAARLLRRPDIATALSREMAARAKRCGITPERIVEEFARIAFADMRLFGDWGPKGVELKSAAELGDASAAVIASVANENISRTYDGLRIKTFDKLKALESLARIFGLNIAEPIVDMPHA